MKEIVCKEYPNAQASVICINIWTVRIKPHGRVLGMGSTEEKAWIDAVKTMKKEKRNG